MNERVIELAQQAEMSANMGDHIDVKVMMENFLKLIVQECCDVLYDNELGGYQVNHTLKEHFGVK